jgi:hypothetical protein
MHITSEIIEILNNIRGVNFLQRYGINVIIIVYDSPNIPIINPIRIWLISFFDFIVGNKGEKME